MKEIELTKELKQMRDDLFSNIHGCEVAKTVLFLSLVDNPKINVLIVGDPGTGKTSFLKQINFLNNGDPNSGQ